MNTDPSNAPTSLVIALESILQPLEPGEFFLPSKPLHVELGSGDGSFLVQYAALHPEFNFIGVERLLGRLNKIDRKGRRAGLENLRVLRIEAAYFLQFLLPPKSVSTLHIYFPDPWPKRKHRKNRLINTEFPDLAKRTLLSEGKVFLRTDDEDYFKQMNAVFDSAPDFIAIEVPAELQNVLTDFERGFLKRGIETRRAGWQLKG